MNMSKENSRANQLKIAAIGYDISLKQKICGYLAFNICGNLKPDTLLPHKYAFSPQWSTEEIKLAEYAASCQIEKYIMKRKHEAGCRAEPGEKLDIFEDTENERQLLRANPRP